LLTAALVLLVPVKAVFMGKVLVYREPTGAKSGTTAFTVIVHVLGKVLVIGEAAATVPPVQVTAVAPKAALKAPPLQPAPRVLPVSSVICGPITVVPDGKVSVKLTPVIAPAVQLLTVTV
jgi:hypothetical protein